MRAHNVAVFLSGTLLNIATVLIGTSIGLLAGARVPQRMQESLVTGNAFFIVVLGISMAIRLFTDPAAVPGHDLAILAALLVGVAFGELLRLHDGSSGSVAGFSAAWRATGRAGRAGSPRDLSSHRWSTASGR
jgi:uncharacterized membrane protein YqgA involved in biofilm formation